MSLLWANKKKHILLCMTGVLCGDTRIALGPNAGWLGVGLFQHFVSSKVSINNHPHIFFLVAL